MNITVKKMESDDEIKGKAYVHYKAWQEAYREIVDSSYLKKLTLEKCEEIAYRFTDNLIVAKDKERVIGFAGYGKYRSDELINTGEIHAIYILSEYYGKNAGTALMQEALRHLDEYPQTALWVLKDNQRAIAFYEKCGFKADGREEIINLGTPVSEIRMIRNKSQ